jgi:hypothetical protein
MFFKLKFESNHHTYTYIHPKTHKHDINHNKPHTSQVEYSNSQSPSIQHYIVIIHKFK